MEVLDEEENYPQPLGDYELEDAPQDEQPDDTSPLAFSPAQAKEIISCFDVRDDDTLDFLTDLVASGNAPDEELKQVLDIAVMSGTEDWYLLLACAKAMRDQDPDIGPSWGVHGLLYCLDKVFFLQDSKAAESPQEIRRTPPRTAEKTVDMPAEKAAVAALEEHSSPAKAPKKSPYGWSSSPFWPEQGVYETPDYAPYLPLDPRLGGSPYQPVSDMINGLGDGGLPDCKKELGTVSSTTSLEHVFLSNANGGQGDNAKKRRTSKRVNDCTNTAEVFESTSGSVVHNHIEPGEAHNRSLYLGSAAPQHTTVKDFDTLVEEFKEFFDQPLLPNEQSSSAPELSSHTTTKKSSKSPFFTPPASFSKTPSPKKTRPPRGTISALPVPSLSAPRFGLIQEELAHDPFRLLIAITFLVRTPGRLAIPVFRQVMERFPTPAALAAAEARDIIAMIQHLGLAAVRCAAVQKYARIWGERPPSREVRYGVKNYPKQNDGKDVRVREELGAEDDDDGGGGGGVLARGRGSAWEIGHLTQGRYAIDSWRIFCRDVLLGRAEDWMGKGRDPEFQPEWMRVLPEDKELRACLRWMWMREGWEWDPVTGEREVLREEMRRAVDEGRVGYDDQGQLQILESAAEPG